MYAFSKVKNIVSSYSEKYNESNKEGIVLFESIFLENDDIISLEEAKESISDCELCYFTYELIGEISEEEINILKKFQVISEIEYTTKCN